MHDLGRIRQDLQETLSLDKGPVALLLGAGCPLAVRVPRAGGGTTPLIPDIAGLTQLVREQLADDARFQALLSQFKEDNRTEYTIEDLMSHVRLLRRIAGNGRVRGLTSADLEFLDADLSERVASAVEKELPSTDTPYHHLADWIGGTSRAVPLTLFTTNYDLLAEQALEERGLPVFDGFVGVRKPFFDIRAIEDDDPPKRWVRLWKVHGSINWCLESGGSVIRTANRSAGTNLLIHPSELKYDQSRRMPYLAMIDRLRAFLRQPNAFFVTVGYSFADAHLNEVIFEGLRGNPTAAGFGLLYGKASSEVGVQKVRSETRLPLNLSLVLRDEGVIRGVSAPWSSSADSSSGTVESDLGDFSVFAQFLRDLARNPRDR